MYNAGSNVDVIVDVAGRFDYFPYPLPPGVTASSAPATNKPPVARPSYQYSQQ